MSQLKRNWKFVFNHVNINDLDSILSCPATFYILSQVCVKFINYQVTGFIHFVDRIRLCRVRRYLPGACIKEDKRPIIVIVNKLRRQRDTYEYGVLMSQGRPKKNIFAPLLNFTEGYFSGCQFIVDEGNALLKLLNMPLLFQSALTPMHEPFVLMLDDFYILYAPLHHYFAGIYLVIYMDYWCQFLFTDTIQGPDDFRHRLNLCTAWSHYTSRYLSLLSRPYRRVDHSPWPSRR